MVDGCNNCELLQQLAGAFGVETTTISGLRRQGEAFSCVDVATMTTGKGRDFSAHQIRQVRERYADLQEQILKERFPGRGRETPVGDTYAVVELIMLLPGRRAGLVRNEAARLFARYYGGDRIHLGPANAVATGVAQSVNTPPGLRMASSAR